VPETRVQVMVNLANPSAAYRWWRLPTDRVGLARMEFIISRCRRGESGKNPDSGRFQTAEKETGKEAGKCRQR
jgi:phosphoenolpyruvate synthase/pyruvate phosphate dikinase